MKLSFFNAAMMGTALAASLISPVYAGNSTVENALSSRPDLSTFYKGLVSTGVINELKEGQSYTVFAPTNEAFTKISPDKYPCFYTAECKAQVAEVLRKHIVPGEKHLSDIGQRPGNGVMSMFSLDNQHIVGSEPYKNAYAVDGQNVLSTEQLASGMLYTTDGVLATKHELSEFNAPIIAMVGTTLPPRIPEGRIVTITTDTPTH